MAWQVFREAAIRGAPALLAAALAATPIGCGGSDATHQAVHALQGDLARLRAENGALAERLEALEIRAGKRGSDAELPDLMAAPRYPGQPDLQVVRLVPAGSPSAKGRPEEELTVLKSTPNGVVMDSSTKEDRRALAKSEFERAESLLAAKKYDAALVAYAGFVVRFPEDPRATAATVRRGECFFHKNDPARAVEQLEAALGASPPPERSNEALSLLVKAYEALGDTAGASRARDRLARAAAPASAPTPAPTKKP